MSECVHCGKDLSAHVIGVTKYGCPRDESASAQILYWMLIVTWVLGAVLMMVNL